MPIIECDDAKSKLVNYFMLCHLVYKATAVAKTIFDRLIKVHHFIKPEQQKDNLEWTHTQPFSCSSEVQRIFPNQGIE